MQQWPVILEQATRRPSTIWMDCIPHYVVGTVTKVILAPCWIATPRPLAVDQEAPYALALHAITSASAGVLEALLQVYPKAIRMQDKYGRMLYHAFTSWKISTTTELILRCYHSLRPQMSTCCW
jgi:hypothetical protein